jgi:hypothetical protein
LKSHYEVSEPNTMQAVIGSIVAVSAFGAAYAANVMFPIQPIADADLLLNQSTMGTVNIFSKDSLKQIAPTPREMIDLYLKKQANLEDILDIITSKPNAKDAYEFLKTQEPTVENKFLIKACETHYGFTPSTNIETQG